jgi:hypothetical protein
VCGGRRDFWGVQGEGLGCQLYDTLLSATIKEALAQMTYAYAQFSYTEFCCFSTIKFNEPHSM